MKKIILPVAVIFGLLFTHFKLADCVPDDLIKKAFFELNMQLDQVQLETLLKADKRFEYGGTANELLPGTKTPVYTSTFYFTSHPLIDSMNSGKLVFSSFRYENETRDIQLYFSFSNTSELDRAFEAMKKYFQQPCFEQQAVNPNWVTYKSGVYKVHLNRNNFPRNTTLVVTVNFR